MFAGLRGRAGKVERNALSSLGGEEEWHGILSDGRSRNGGWPAEYNRTACDSVENVRVCLCLQRECV